MVQETKLLKAEFGWLVDECICLSVSTGLRLVAGVY